MSQRVTKLLIASLHLRAADEFHALPGAGAAAYLNVDALMAVAGATGCDAIHPGYGFPATDSASPASHRSVVIYGLLRTEWMTRAPRPFQQRSRPC
jgi:biotin carboxylase